MSKHKKHFAATAAFCAVLAGGGIAGAALGSPAVSSAQTETSTTAAAGDMNTDSARPQHGRGPGLDAAAAALGISTDDLRTALEDGQTIAQVATTKGVELQTVIDAIVADATAHIDAKVASGELDSAKAEELKADLSSRITDMVNGVRPTGGPGGEHGGPGREHGGRNGGPGLDAAATAIGISADDLRTALDGGQTIAEVAASKGVDVQVVIDAMVDDARDHITARVNGEQPADAPPASS